MNSENSETSKSYSFILHLAGETRPDKYIALSSKSICYKSKNITKSCIRYQIFHIKIIRYQLQHG